jgi:hypothetical protein
MCEPAHVPLPSNINININLNMSSMEVIPLPLTIPTPKRCGANDCKKKLALTDFPCRCEKRFCSLHRMPEDHLCTYNYRAAADLVLSKQLVRCAGERLVDKI